MYYTLAHNQTELPAVHVANNVAFYIFFLLIGIWALMFNLILLLIIKKVNPIKPNLMFISALAVANIFGGMGCIAENTRKFVYGFIHQPSKATVGECFSSSPHLCLYTIAYSIFTYFQLAVGLERLLSFYRLGLHYVIFTKTRAKIICLVCTLLSFIIPIIIFINVGMNAGNIATGRCRSGEIISQQTLDGNAYFLFFLNAISIMIFICTLSFFNRQKREIRTEMRILQLKAEFRIAKCVFSALMTTAICQSLPWAIIYIFPKNQYTLFAFDFLGELSSLSWPITALMLMFMHPDLSHDAMKKFRWNSCCSKSTSTSVVYIGD
ncbi:hypothetical protein T12_12976 [Trichinella patagoniensis]|uniref:G-protein coupled receptors family 1 profile domain-containing protein n=1 Tax=Trichinella patagoniensis TaxID=990121 RepID=A0A0V1AC43_9BILA|nr:hypothetical protein T12_12976 [Trichinella patagoniensis]